MENRILSLDELLETGFETEVEIEEERENLGWGLLSSSFLILTGG